MGLHDCREEERDAFRRQHIGMIFQDARLLPHLSVAANIGLSETLRGLVSSPSRQRITWCAEQVGVQDLLQQKSGTLSSGEAQRVLWLAPYTISHPSFC